MKIKTLIVDDHAIIIDGLVALLENHPNIEVTSTTSSALFALAHLKNESIDLLITDYSMPEMSGVDLVKKSRAICPNIKVIMLSMHDEPHLIQDVLTSGVDAYILKKYARQELFQAIDAVLNQGQYWSPEVTKALIRLNTHLASPPSTDLTERELEVLKLLAKGLKSKQIAERLFISERTVETHRKNLLRKTDSSNIVGLLKYAMTNKLTD